MTIVPGDFIPGLTGGFWRDAPKQDIDIQAVLADYLVPIDSILTLTGNIESKVDVTASLTITVYDAADTLLATIFTGSVSISAGTNDIPTLVGAAVTWDSTGQSLGTYYFRVDVSVVTPSELAQEKLHFSIGEETFIVVDGISVAIAEDDEINISIEVLP